MANNLPLAVQGIAEPEPEPDDYQLNAGYPFGRPTGRPHLAQRAPFAVVPPNAQFLAPARRRNSIAVVLYAIRPQGGGFGAEGNRFILDRDTLFTHLPRTRHSVRRGTLDLESFFMPQDMEAHPQDLIHRALNFIFHHLEGFSRTGVLDMFGAAEQQIEDDPARDRAVNCWAAKMHAICVVLDNERGLGCSEDLQGHVLDFFEILIQDVHHLLGWYQTTILFEAFAGVFHTERRDLVGQVRRIWGRFDPEVQEQLLRDMKRALPVEGIGGMAHRMYRALGN
ncbi:hypothetical protein ACJ41O_000894 [Fusarium nematophilum]